MNNEEKDLIMDFYSVAVTESVDTFTGNTLIGWLDKMYSSGATAQRLRSMNKTLPELLAQSQCFEDAGRGMWRKVRQDYLTSVVDSIADKTGNRKRGGNNSRGRGASVSARGRGTYVTRGGGGYQRNGLGMGRGSSYGPNSSSHGFSFRPPVNSNRPPPPAQPNETFNQRPFPSKASDSGRNSTMDSSYNRGNSQNRNDDDRAYNNSQYSRCRYKSQSPQRRSPPRDYYGEKRNVYRNNGARDYDNDGRGYDRRDFDNERSNNGYTDDRFGGNSSNDNRYNGNYNRRRSPSPQPYYGKGFDNNRGNRYNDYDDHDNRSYNDYGNQRRPPSPPRIWNEYREGRDDYANGRDNYGNQRPYDNQPYRSPTPPRNYSPPRNSYRNDPPRPDSRSSNYSQFSEGSNTNVEASNVCSDDRTMSGPPVIPLKLNRPPGIPLSTEGPPGIPVPNNAPPGLSVRSENSNGSVSRPDVRVESNLSDADEVQKRLICKELLEARNKYDSKVRLEDFDHDLQQRGIRIPGRVLYDREQYIIQLKKQNPGLFKDVYIDEENSFIHWKNMDVTLDVTEAYASGSKEKDHLDYAIMRRIKSIRTTTFNINHELTDLVVRTGEPQSLIKLRVTNALFNTYDGDYKYFSRDVIINDKVTNSNVPYEFRASLVPKAFKSNKEYYKVGLGRFRKFSNFSVRPSESSDELEKMERDLQDMMDSKRANAVVAPEGGWKPNHGCLVEYVDPGVFRKWARGIVVKIESQFTRIYLLDYGVWLMMKVENMRILPQEYLSVPPYCISCKLHANEDERFEIDMIDWTDTLSNCSDKMFISFKDTEVSDDGLTTFVVDVFVQKFNGELVDILSLHDQ